MERTRSRSSRSATTSWDLILNRDRGTYELYDWTADYYEQRDLYETWRSARRPGIFGRCSAGSSCSSTIAPTPQPSGPFWRRARDGAVKRVDRAALAIVIAATAWLTFTAAWGIGGDSGRRAPRRRQCRYLHGRRADDPLEDPLPGALLVHRHPARGRGAHVPPPLRPVLRPRAALSALRPPRLAHPPSRGLAQRGDPAAALRDHEGTLGRARRRRRRCGVRGRTDRRRLLELLEPRDDLHLRLAPLLLGALAAPRDVAHAATSPRASRACCVVCAGRLGGVPARRADADVGLPARLRPPGAAHASLPRGEPYARWWAICVVIMAASLALVDRPLRARRPDSAVARGRGLARRRQARDDVATRSARARRGSTSASRRCHRARQAGGARLPRCGACSILRRDEETYALGVLFGAVVQYVAFRKGADVHIYWPHYFAAYFALAMAQLAATSGIGVAWLVAALPPDARAARRGRGPRRSASFPRWRWRTTR